MIDRAFLQDLAAGTGVPLEPKTLGLFDRYAELLVEWNEKMNLTAITDPGEIIVKHFYDSLLLLTCVNLARGGAVIDVGTGAGFPGVPLKLARPDLSLTLLDSLNKRVNFLSGLCRELGVEAACIHARAEEGGRQENLRERFDLATARAVARLRELAEYCLPFVKVGGCFAALKGPEMDGEAAEAASAIRLLGGEIEKICPFTLPDGSGRSIVIIKKKSQTSPKYPRSALKMKKFPLQ